MTQWLSEDEHRTWRNVLRMHSRLLEALAQSLRADSDMSLPDYEVLAVLSESPGGALRSLDLRTALRWDKSRLAHHVRRMEQRGLVERSECTEDGRASVVHITPAGTVAIEAAAPAHVEQVRALFFDALTPEQVRALDEAAESVLARLDELQPTSRLR